ncbi:virion core protein, T7 gp14 family [Agrobacterium deltaense]
MCDPITMVAAALGTAQTVTGYMGERQAAAAQNAMVRENQKAANANLVREYADVQTRQIQEEDAAAVQKQDLSREARAARATTMAAAGEAGVSGLSVDALLADVYGKEATAKDRISQNSGFTTANLTREMDGLKAKAQDRINSMPWATGPSPFAAALKIGGVGLDSYNRYGKPKQP